MGEGVAMIKLKGPKDRRMKGGRVLEFIKTLIKQDAVVAVDLNSESAIIKYKVPE